jgi:hypothetical protein
MVYTGSMTTRDEPLRTGDTIPNHVAVLEGCDEHGVFHTVQVHELDLPFIGFFYPSDRFPTWRTRILSKQDWEAEQERTDAIR